MTIHPEIEKEVNMMFRQLAFSHPHTMKQQGGALTIQRYAKLIVHIQSEIDTLKLRHTLGD
jgi:hypothetical protein